MKIKVGTRVVLSIGNSHLDNLKASTWIRKLHAQITKHFLRNLVLDDEIKGAGATLSRILLFGLKKNAN